MEKRTARILKRERLLDAFFKVDELSIEMLSSMGQPLSLQRLVFERGHAAAVLPYDPVRDCVVLISEMRPGILSAGDDAFSYSIVAGMIDEGEDGPQTIMREAEEEAGLTVENLFEIHKGAYVSPGGCSEKVGLYCGLVDSTKLAALAGKPEEGEDIQTHVVSFTDFMGMIDSQRIDDLKTITAGYWLQRERPSLREHL